MNDLISREEAVEALLEKGQSSRRYKLGEIWELNFDEIREALATVPSAEAIPVSWIKERIENAINAKQTLIAQMWLELIDGYMRETNDTKRD